MKFHIGAAILAASFLFWQPAELEAGKGSFIILQRSSLYETSQMKKRVARISRRAAFDVLDFRVNRETKLMKYQISAALDSEKKTEIGFIPRAPGNAEVETVKVYASIPENESELGGYVEIPASAFISKTPLSEEKKPFGVDWEQIEYRVEQFKTYWVYSNGGIYRPDLNARELKKLHEELSGKGFSYSRMVLILGGYVNVGFRQSWVELALGKPFSVTVGPKGREEWIYANRKIVFNRKRVSLIVYNEKKTSGG